MRHILGAAHAHAAAGLAPLRSAPPSQSPFAHSATASQLSQCHLSRHAGLATASLLNSSLPSCLHCKSVERDLQTRSTVKATANKHVSPQQGNIIVCACTTRSRFIRAPAKGKLPSMSQYQVECVVKTKFGRESRLISMRDSTPLKTLLKRRHSNRHGWV